MIRTAAATCFALLLSLAGSAAHALETVAAEGMVEAPVSEVWAAWSTADGLRSWLAPHAEIDLRVDGLMRTNYNPAGRIGDAGTIENRILAYEPQRMLSMRVAKAPAGFPFPNAVAQMWSVVYLREDGPGRTHVRIVGLGFGADEESQKMKAFFDRGNAYTLAQLQKRFQPR